MQKLQGMGGLDTIVSESCLSLMITFIWSSIADTATRHDSAALRVEEQSRESTETPVARSARSIEIV